MSLILIGTLASGQTKKTGVIGNKNIETSHRQIPKFNHLRVIGLDVELLRGNETSITLTAETNVIKHIITQVQNDTLIIQFEKGQQLRDIAEPKIGLVYQNLNSILGSVSSIKAKSPLQGDTLKIKLQTNSSIEGDLNFQHLNLSLKTSCKAILTGSCSTSDVILHTESILDAPSLNVAELNIIEETLCLSTVNVSNKLTAQLFAESKLSNVGKASSSISYPSMDQMSSMKTIGNNVDIYKFN